LAATDHDDGKLLYDDNNSVAPSSSFRMLLSPRSSDDLGVARSFTPPPAGNNSGKLFRF